MDEELNEMIGLEYKSTMLHNNYATKKNKLGDITEMVISLNELDKKKLKNGELTSLNLGITDQAGDVIAKPGTTVVLHIRYFKMYITINNIKGEKRIDLSYSVQNFDSDKERLGACSTEIAVIRMLSNNVKYEILKLHAVMDPISDTKKMIPRGNCAGRELLSL